MSQVKVLPREPVSNESLYERFKKALELACYYQNKCCELEEIVEMFCLDAEVKNEHD